MRASQWIDFNATTSSKKRSKQRGQRKMQLGKRIQFENSLAKLLGKTIKFLALLQKRQAAIISVHEIYLDKMDSAIRGHWY
jgi:hypothetical protein